MSAVLIEEESTYSQEPCEVFSHEPEMRTIEQQADDWLVSWSRWTRGDRGAAGYPSRAVTERANEGGITAGSPRPPTELPEEEAKTDRAVATLGGRDKSILRRVIRLHWERGLPREGVAAELNCSRSEAVRLIARCKRAIYRIRSVL